MDIPVYLVAGFLDSGKTSFINGILEDGFAREDRTLLICCEEGDEEYEKKALERHRCHGRRRRGADARFLQGTRKETPP